MLRGVVLQNFFDVSITSTTTFDIESPHYYYPYQRHRIYVYIIILDYSETVFNVVPIISQPLFFISFTFMRTLSNVRPSRSYI